MAIADMPRDIWKSHKKHKKAAVGETSDTASTSRPTETSSQISHDNSSEHRQSISQEANASQSSLSLATPDTPPTGAQTPTTQSEQQRTMSPRHNSVRDSPMSPSAAFTMESAVGTAKGVNRIIDAGIKSPMNFCLGMAKGFRNMPRLYNDDLVRPVDKVTDLSSGIKVAGKELGYGFFDGVAGLVMQPLHGAEKDGAVGLVKGVGKGIGGLILKPAAGIFGLPAYAMQGFHAEIGKHFSRSVYNYIISSRIKQGAIDIQNSSEGEREDILRRWNNLKFDLSSFYHLKRKMGGTDGPFPPPPPFVAEDDSDTVSIMDRGFSKPRTSWLQTRHLTTEQRRRMVEEKQTWKRGYVEAQVKEKPSPAIEAAASATNLAQEDEEVERAIQASVRETSRGDVEDDAEVEAAIRESLRSMRENGALPATGWIEEKNLRNDDPSIFDDDEFKITDEEYQDLIQSAMRQSMAEHYGYPLDDDQGFPGASSSSFMPPRQGALVEEPSEMDDLYEAADSSRHQRHLPVQDTSVPAQPAVGISPEELAALEAAAATEEEELQRAINASKEDMHRMQSERNEEDIVLEYIKKQSLAEEEFRKKYTKGKGTGRHDDYDDDNDEELKRAMEESLRMTSGGSWSGEGSGSRSNFGNGGGSSAAAPP